MGVITTGIFELKGIGFAEFSIENLNSKGQEVLNYQILWNDIPISNLKNINSVNCAY